MPTGNPGKPRGPRTGKHHSWDWEARERVTIEGREYPLWTCKACGLQMAGGSQWRKRKGELFWSKKPAGSCPSLPAGDQGTDEGGES